MPATHDPRPIGVFDSGLGGLTAVRELFRALPHESVVYFGDTARLPYGNKSRETVTRFSLEIASFLVRQNVKCLLVACNTASSLRARDAARSGSTIPVVGVIEPAAQRRGGREPARPDRRDRHARHGRQRRLRRARSSGSRPARAVISRACPLFVPLVEEGWLDHPVTRAGGRGVPARAAQRRTSRA